MNPSTLSSWNWRMMPRPSAGANFVKVLRGTGRSFKKMFAKTGRRWRIPDIFDEFSLRSHSSKMLWSILVIQKSFKCWRIFYWGAFVGFGAFPKCRRTFLDVWIPPEFAKIVDILKVLHIDLWWVALFSQILSRQFCVLRQLWGSSPLKIHIGQKPRS